MRKIILTKYVYSKYVYICLIYFIYSLNNLLVIARYIL